MVDHKTKQAKVCQICGSAQNGTLRPAIIVRPAVVDVIRDRFGRWDERGWICDKDLQSYRQAYVKTLLETEKGELTKLEEEVIDSMRQHEVLSSNLESVFETGRTFRERLADRMTAFVGSWTFLLFFGTVILAWILANTYVLIVRPFDPYPYIFLNLVLSCLAAIQAPIIMMSQNRQDTRDRLRAVHNYQINLKAELEIRHLHQKIDHLLSRQWERLLAIQEIQMELINEMRKS